MPAEKNAEATIGTIQCTFAPLVQPNQNIEMGSITAPTIAIGRRSSGTKSTDDVSRHVAIYVEMMHVPPLTSFGLNILSA